VQALRAANLLEPGLTVNIVAGLNRGAVLSESSGTT
jgi:hypothetical protein